MKSNLTKEEERGREKASKDKEKVFTPAKKDKVMVNKAIEVGGESNCKYKMEKVMTDIKARPAIRLKK